MADGNMQARAASLSSPLESQASPLNAQETAAGFADLHPPLSPSHAALEASRCLYCYDAPCIAACPTAIDIPGFIHQIRTGNLDGAGRTILSANIMGGTCARACPTEILCEQACVVNKLEGAPVRIGALQRHAVDPILEAKAPHPFVRAPRSGKRFAVVGAGPAGLAFAHRAALLGHDVVVYEARPKPGGLNEYGLAAYKMAGDFAQREVAFLLGVGGVSIEYGAALGAAVSLSSLRRDHDGVFLGLGLAKAQKLGTPGEDLEGVQDALSFIAALRQSPDPARLPVGEDVVVIGGGATAIDAAIQAKRLQALKGETGQVTLVYRRGAQEMSATRWEQDFARTNGVAIRHWAAPSRIEGEGRAQSVVFARTRPEAGRLIATEQSFTLPADLVLVAIGQKLAAPGLEELRMEGGKIWVDENLQTSLPGVYAGGDCIGSGADLTVQAIADGARAAHAADRALRAQADDRALRAQS